MVTYDFQIHTPDGKPTFFLRTDHQVSGIAQNEFSYVNKEIKGRITDQQHRGFLADVRNAHPRKLAIKHDRKLKERPAFGWIDLDDQNYRVNVSRDHSGRVRIQTLIDKLINGAFAKKIEKSETRKEEGDFMTARPVTLVALLANPAKFDGKRVRVEGYCHVEFECSNFGTTVDSDYEKSVWLCNHSSFANPANIRGDNDCFLKVEGTFKMGRGGHLGLWAGELQRLTMQRKIKP